MRPLHCPIDDALVVLVDVQPSFMAAIAESDRVLERCRFLLEAARALRVPTISTIQNPTRMGGLDVTLNKYLQEEPFSKMTFSCWANPEFRGRIEDSGRSSIVLVGIETHICVTLTALELLDSGYRVFVCPDAVSSRSVERHKLGMERMRDAGAMPAHTESLVYEWMGSAENAVFREVLQVVKGSKY